MAIFNPADPGVAVDTRFLVAWREGSTIGTIAGSGTNNLVVTAVGGNPVLTYSGSTTMTASGNTPTAGTFETIGFTHGIMGGTLTGIAPSAFAAIDDLDAYRIFDGSDTINGSTAGGDFLFAGYGGNDVLDGMGGGDSFKVSGRTGIPVLTIKGVPGATDTLFVEKNIYTGETVLDLRSSVLTSINAITLDPGFTVVIRSGQLGSGVSAGAAIGATSGNATFDILKDNNSSPLDVLGALNVHPNTTLRIFGSQSAETIFGSGGAEVFYGNEGADTVNGRGGNDIFYLENLEDEFDTINGGAGIDTVRTIGPDNWAVLNGFNAKASSIEVWEGDAKGNAAANLFDFRGLTGPAAPDATFLVWGGAGNDTILAPGFQFLMAGEEGNDTLTGGKGSDQFLGGAGGDALTGGDEADLFYYFDVKDSAKKKSLRDTITDFTVKSDKISLELIDANGKKKDGDQAFKFVKQEGGAFKNKAGSVIWDQIDKAGTAKDMTVVYADTNGDHKADMAIQLTGLIDLQKGDFFL